MIKTRNWTTKLTSDIIQGIQVRACFLNTPAQTAAPKVQGLNMRKCASCFDDVSCTPVFSHRRLNLPLSRNPSKIVVVRGRGLLLFQWGRFVAVVSSFSAAMHVTLRVLVLPRIATQEWVFSFVCLLSQHPFSYCTPTVLFQFSPAMILSRRKKPHSLAQIPLSSLSHICVPRNGASRRTVARIDNLMVS